MSIDDLLARVYEEGFTDGNIVGRGGEIKDNNCMTNYKLAFLKIIIEAKPNTVKQNERRDDDSNHSFDSAEAFNEGVDEYMKHIIDLFD